MNSSNHSSSATIVDKTELPVIAAPMFLVSSPAMVIEACKAGIIGTFPLLNARTGDILEEWMLEITRELQKAKEKDMTQTISPWGVNLNVHRSNVRYEPDVELIKKHKPPIVITSLGNPSPIVDIVHDYGGYVYSDVISLYHARKAADSGVDGLVLVCAGAGGHGGTLNPIAFVGAVRKFWNGLLILSGSISSGQDILAAQAMGADLAYMGTRFITATESSAPEAYKQMLIESSLEDLIYTDAFSGVKGNYLKPSIRNAGLDPDNLDKKDQNESAKVGQGKPKKWKDIWSAGQGVDSVEKIQPVAEIVDQLRLEYAEAKENLLSKK